MKCLRSSIIKFNVSFLASSTGTIQSPSIVRSNNTCNVNLLVGRGEEWSVATRRLFGITIYYHSRQTHIGRECVSTEFWASAIDGHDVSPSLVTIRIKPATHQPKLDRDGRTLAAAPERSVVHPAFETEIGKITLIKQLL